MAGKTMPLFIAISNNDRALLVRFLEKRTSELNYCIDGLAGIHEEASNVAFCERELGKVDVLLTRLENCVPLTKVDIQGCVRQIGKLIMINFDEMCFRTGETPERLVAQAHALIIRLRAICINAMRQSQGAK